MSTVVFSLILVATTAQFELTTLDEETVRGELIGLSPETAAVRTEEGDRMFNIDELLSIRPVPLGDTATSPTNRNDGGPVVIELADGSTMHAKAYAVKSGRATITLADDTKLSIPARRVRAVRFLEQSDAVKALWQDIVASKPNGDVVVVRKGGDSKPITLDFLEGAIRDVSEATVQFDFEGDLIPVNRAKVQVEGLIYYQTDRKDASPAICRIETEEGRWMANKLSLDVDSLQFATPVGIEHELPLAAIENFDFSLGKIAYLSDLEPVKKTWQPYLGSVASGDSARQLFDIRRDRTFAGDPITLADRRFRKGLAVHSRTEISYRLPGQFSRFEATIGIDPSQKRRGHVRLEIRGDNRVLYDKPIAGDAAPQPLELDITGVGRLTVLVDYGEGWDIGDQLLLGGARVIR